MKKAIFLFVVVCLSLGWAQTPPSTDDTPITPDPAVNETGCIPEERCPGIAPESPVLQRLRIINSKMDFGADDADDEIIDRPIYEPDDNAIPPSACGDETEVGDWVFRDRGIRIHIEGDTNATSFFYESDRLTFTHKEVSFSQRRSIYS
jgi:hypothetical protein